MPNAHDSSEQRTIRLTEAPSLLRTLARGTVTARGRSGTSLPAVTYELTTGIPRERLSDYQRLCGFPVGDALPPTYPHVLGFPLQAHLMADRAFPLPLPGLVHVSNTITVHRVLSASEELTVRVRAERLRNHPKGRVVDLVTCADVQGERVWDGVSKYLHRGSGDPDADPGDLGPRLPDGPPVAQWRLGADLGRRYAGVSGDVNPIHLSAPSARAMGFPRAIAHGMWTYAATLAALGRRASVPSTSHVWFRKPVLIPGRVELCVDSSGPVVVAGLRSAPDHAVEQLVLNLQPATEN